MNLNLLQETWNELSQAGKLPEEVLWVGKASGDKVLSWEEFLVMSDFEYDNGFGGANVDPELVIVFSDGSWLERGEYDGSEWWEFKQTPARQEVSCKLESLKSDD